MNDTARMMTYQDYRSIIADVQRYGDVCERFGDYMSDGRAEDCRKLLDDLKSRLMEYVDKRTVPPKTV